MRRECARYGGEVLMGGEWQCLTPGCELKPASSSGSCAKAPIWALIGKTVIASNSFFKYGKIDAEKLHLGKLVQQKIEIKEEWKWKHITTASCGEATATETGSADTSGAVMDGHYWTAIRGLLIGVQEIQLCHVWSSLCLHALSHIKYFLNCHMGCRQLDSKR